MRLAAGASPKKLWLKARVNHVSAGSHQLSSTPAHQRERGGSSPDVFAAVYEQLPKAGIWESWIRSQTLEVNEPQEPQTLFGSCWGWR